jgi:hypothetical protein
MNPQELEPALDSAQVIQNRVHNCGYFHSRGNCAGDDGAFTYEEGHLLFGKEEDHPPPSSQKYLTI